MTNWRKILSLLLVLALAATMLAGCGKTEEAAPNADAPTQEQAGEPAKEAAPAEAEEEIIEITWATWALAEESLYDIYMSMIESFMEAHPNVKINTLTYPYSQYKDQLMIAAAGGNAPTFAHIKADWSKAVPHNGKHAKM